MHSNNTTIFPILCPNIQKIFYLLFALLLIFDGPLSVRAGQKKISKKIFFYSKDPPNFSQISRLPNSSIEEKFK